MNTYGNHDSTSRRSARAPRPLASLALLCAFLAPATARAATSTADTVWMDISAIRVAAAPGGGYTGVPNGTMSWEAEFDIDAGGLARIKSWQIYPRLSTGGQAGLGGIATLYLTDYKVSKSYPVGDRPTSVHRTEGMSYPASAVSDFATQVCNRNMQNLVVDEGLTEHQVFAEERVLTVSLESGLSFEARSFSSNDRAARSSWTSDVSDSTCSVSSMIRCSNRGLPPIFSSLANVSMKGLPPRRSVMINVAPVTGTSTMRMPKIGTRKSRPISSLP